MSKLTNQWIELFRSGKAEGKPEFTNADIDQIVQNYDPSFHEAPATIGHIENAGPAWGWFDGLKRTGNVLLGKMRQVQPAFEEMVSSGLFKKRSVGLVKDEKGWNLHHVAFLGAQAPAIKGLADCKFGTEVTGLTQVEFEEDSMAEQETSEARFTAWLKELFSKAAVPAAATFTEADVKRIAQEAVTASETRLQAQFAERDKVLANAETKARAEAAIAKLRSAGRWVPAFDKIGLPVVFAALAPDVTLVEFGEGETKKKVTPLDAFVAFMEQLPAIVPTAPIYTGQSAAVAAAKTPHVNETRHFSADPNSVQLNTLVEARAREKSITYGEALSQITVERPELTVAGGSTAGQV